MEHLVKAYNNGGYYVTCLDIKEECNETIEDEDEIIFSWKEGEELDIFERYFSLEKIDKKTIKEEYYSGLSKSDIIARIRSCYEDDRYMILILFEDKVINNEEKAELIKLSMMTENKQVELIENTIKYITIQRTRNNVS